MLVYCSVCLHLSVNKLCYVVFHAKDVCVLPKTAIFRSMPPKIAAWYDLQTKGLGDVAILVLDMNHHDINYLSWFLQSLWFDCSIRVFPSFHCQVPSFVFSSVAITNLLASKEILGMVKLR